MIRSGLLIAAGLLLLSGCIKNDLPYPRIQQDILALSADGEIQPAEIDDSKLTATVFLGEDVDIRKVTFNRFEISEGAVADPDLRESPVDLETPIVVNVSRWQKYEWIVKAEQHIERYLRIEGQIGETVIDEVGHRLLVNMPENSDLSKCNLIAVKLGPSGHTFMSPLLQPGRINLSRPLRIAVTSWGRTEDWTIYTEKSQLIAQTTEADAWSEVVWVYGSAPAGMKPGFQYREKGTEEWKDLEESGITQTPGSGTFRGCIPHLSPLTTYEVRAMADGNLGNIMEVTTQGTEILPDGSFDLWHMQGKVWCPWAEGGVQFWDTGNTGAATLGQSNVEPSDDTPIGTGRSARLETRFVGIGSIGKLAAGSIFTGRFAQVDGTNGILDFGRPWTLRPTRLRGYYKYKTAPINYTSAEFEHLRNTPDVCSIYIAMTDWTAPFQIRTNPRNRQLFDPESPAVIAYGSLERNSDTDGWQEFTIELKYKSTSRLPRYIQITCAASKYGDYFTGGTGACLLVDQFSLEYDY